MSRFVVLIFALLCACSATVKADVILPSELREGETFVAMFQTCDIESCKRGLARIEGNTIRVAERSRVITDYQRRILDAWLISGCLGEGKGDDDCSGSVVMRTAVMRGHRLLKVTEPKFFSGGTSDFSFKDIVLELIRNSSEAEVWSELDPTQPFEVWFVAEKS